MKKFIQEFGAFIKRGNVLDLAVGLIIGTAFNAIIKSMVNDVIMPLVGLIVGDDFSLLKIVLVEQVMDPLTQVITTNEVAIRYGAFIQTIIDFLLIALSIFVAVKIISAARARIEKAKEKLRKQEEAEAVLEPVVVSEPKPTTEDLLTEIRDLLKQTKE
ncbi:MAG: large conductance mechanosensitive channel protein MscL [Bacilli bacterium]|nr:large conductance mechanosensitive channel protein MscL [Bacilli bacterium]